MNAKAILFSLLFFLLNFDKTLGENTIEIPEKVLNRGIIDTISIYFSTDSINLNNINFTLKFNAYILDIRQVVGNTNFFITEPSPKYYINLNNIEEATLTIESNNLNRWNEQKILCQLIVEGLVYKDSVDTIKISNLEINGNPVKFVANGGIVIVRGPSVIPVKSNYLSGANPLPGENFLWFFFGISKPSYLSISILNSLGEQIYSSESNPELFQITASNNQYSPQDKLEDGDYRLDVHLPPQFPSGTYFLRLNAYSIGIFLTKFLIVK